LGDRSRSCCDVSQPGDDTECSNPEERQTGTSSFQIHGKNRALKNGTTYIYYIIVVTPTSDKLIYTASKRSEPFQYIREGKIFLIPCSVMLL